MANVFKWQSTTQDANGQYEHDFDIAEKMAITTQAGPRRSLTHKKKSFFFSCPIFFHDTASRGFHDADLIMRFSWRHNQPWRQHQLLMHHGGFSWCHSLFRLFWGFHDAYKTHFFGKKMWHLVKKVGPFFFWKVFTLRDFFMMPRLGSWNSYDVMKTSFWPLKKRIADFAIFFF